MIAPVTDERTRQEIITRVTRDRIDVNAGHLDDLLRLGAIVTRRNADGQLLVVVNPELYATCRKVNRRAETG